MNCLQHYMAVSDPDPDNNYRYTDLLYLSKDYKAAIQQAKQLLDRAGSNSDARLYKLIAYSYHELNDSLEALDNMRKYFNTAPDSVFIMKDFETMAELYEQFPDKSDSAAAFLARAVTFEKDDGKRLVCYRKIVSSSERKELDEKVHFSVIGTANLVCRLRTSNSASK